MNRKNILVVGSLNMDMVINLKKIPVPGETVLNESYYYSLGGKGANQACTIGKLEGQVKMLGCIGEDEFGKKLISNLEKFKVDTKDIKITQNINTGMAVVAVDREGNNSIIVSAGANLGCDVEYIRTKKDFIDHSDIILAQLEIPYEAVFEVFKEAHKLGKTLVLNPAPYSDKISDELLKMVDIIIPNETELMSLVGSDDKDFSLDSITKKAKEVLLRGVKNVIVTLGSRGAVLVNRDKVEHFTVDEVKVVDTTAAGDCFSGALVVAIAEGKTIEQSIKFANKASTLAVTKKGAQSSLPSREEIISK